MSDGMLKKSVKILAETCVLVGGFGSILCLPFAFSPELSLIKVAGTYFVAGGILITGGLISLAVLLK